MFGRRRPHDGPTENAVCEQITAFVPDPRGTAMFQSLTAVQGAPRQGHDGQVYVGDRGSAEHTFNGDLGQNLQAFTGVAALAMYGAAKPIAPTSATFDTARAADALDNAPLRIFAARSARQVR